MNWLNTFYQKLDQLNIRQGQLTALVVIILVVMLAIGMVGTMITLFIIVVTLSIIKRYSAPSSQSPIGNNIANPFNRIMNETTLNAPPSTEEKFTKAKSETNNNEKKEDSAQKEIVEKIPPVSIKKMLTSTQFKYATKIPFVGREKELTMLTSAWNKNKNIVIFIAQAGSGKTSVINEWIQQLQHKEKKYQAKKIIRWQLTSALAVDAFFSSTLYELGYRGEPIFSAEERGKKLANLIAQQRILLLLEGLESLQSQPSNQLPCLVNNSIKALLQQLANNNLGLCLITSQQPIVELEGKEQVINHYLKPLSLATGIILLKYFSFKLGKIRANQISNLDKTIEATDGHALTLRLLASYIQQVADGDLTQRNQLPALSPNKRKKMIDKVLEAYEIHLNNTPALSLLYMISLFDDEVPQAAILLLCQAKIPYLTDTLEDNINWEKILTDCCQQSLINPSQTHSPHIITTHPLIRQYFAQRLQSIPNQSIQQAHAVLYNYYASMTSGQPSHLEAMQPLFIAIAHGCAANLHQEVLDEVYWPQILREGKRYLARKLGAFETELLVLKHFFSQPWQQVTHHLKNEDQLVILNWAVTRLQGLNRQNEAIEAMNAELNLQIKQQNWKKASISAHNLSQFYLKKGHLKQAVKMAKHSVTYADKTADPFQCMSQRNALASMQHQLGDWQNAQRNFEKSERWQIKWQAQFPMLYSIWGFRYSHYLLDQGEWQKVKMRAEYALKVVMSRSRNTLDIAQNNLLLGLVDLQQASNGQPAALKKAEPWLQSALKGLRSLDNQSVLPYTLIAYARYHRYSLSFIRMDNEATIQFNQQLAVQPVHLNSIPHNKHYQAALAYLQEAETLIQQNHMSLQYIDYCLEVARLSLTSMQPVFEYEAHHYINQSRQLIDNMGYHRRLNELVYLEQKEEERADQSLVL